MSSEPIMLMLDRPYLDCGIQGSHSDSYLQEFIKSSNVSREIRGLFKNAGNICLHKMMSSDLKDTVVRFVKDSWTPNSELRQLMNEVKDHYFKAAIVTFTELRKDSQVSLQSYRFRRKFH